MSDFLRNAAALLHKKYASKLEPQEEVRLEVIHESDHLKLRCLVGTLARAHEFELMTQSAKARDESEFILLLIDFLDGSLKEFFRHDRRAGFGLDFSKRHYDQTDIWVRQEYRDFEAERLADELLLSADGKKRSKID